VGLEGGVGAKGVIVTTNNHQQPPTNNNNNKQQQQHHLRHLRSNCRTPKLKVKIAIFCSSLEPPPPHKAPADNHPRLDE
jgi:hypothetical protein